MTQYWTPEIEKQVGQRVQTVLSDEQLLSIYRKFGAEALRRSSIFHGLDQFMKDERISGDVCLEIGTWTAMTSVVLSRYFREVVTLDLEQYSNPLKHKVLEHLGIENVRCVDIRDNAHKASIAKALKFDFAYMDGNHADDTESDWAITKGSGRVLMHEAWPWQESVWELLHRLPPHEVSWNGCGLALWRASK